MTTTNQTVTKDRFASDEYIDTQARLPKIQALRGETGASECGYFISVGEMAKAGWIDFDDKKLIEYEHGSGGKEQGLLIQQPRMLVVARSPLFAFDRTLSNSEGRLIVVGQYNKAEHKGQPRFGTGQIYEVVLLDPNNQPLHEIGLAYVAKGSNHATFSLHWQQLVSEVTRFHAIANRIAARPKDARFNALCVFEFKVKRELAGNAAKAAACKVDSHTSPTADNWEQYFLGRNDEVADRFLNLLAPSGNLVLPSNNVLALPEASEGELVD
jgi:hypothetical protein